MIFSKHKGKFKTWLVVEFVVLFGLASIAALCFPPKPVTIAAPATAPVTEPEPAMEPNVEAPVTEPVVTPEPETVTEPVVTPATEPEPAAAPVETPVSEPEPVVTPEPAAKPVPKLEPVQDSARVNDQMILAALWMQRSAEYRALCYQAYNIALERLAWATVEHQVHGSETDKPLALVLDCNDTVFTSIPSDAGLIGTSEPYTDELEAKWQSSGQVEAMPGAPEFLKAVDDLGVQIFYVTNAATDNSENLIKLMQSLGFPQVDLGHVLLPTEENGGSNKKTRFEKVTADYDVVVYLGDSLNDLHLNSYKTDEATRNGISDTSRKSFGVTRVILPNPVYGHWEGALADGYNSLSLAEKDKIRRESLKIWRP